MGGAGAEARREATVGRLLAAWSSGDPDSPRPLVNDGFVLWDAVGGEHRGWPSVRAYFASAIERWPDLSLVPDGRYWHSPDGVAFTWEMTATVPDDRYGPEHAGRAWRSAGMSFVEMDGDLVVREVDYHDGGAVLRSLGQEVR